MSILVKGHVHGDPDQNNLVFYSHRRRFLFCLGKQQLLLQFELDWRRSQLLVSGFLTSLGARMRRRVRPV